MSIFGGIVSGLTDAAAIAAAPATGGTSLAALAPSLISAGSSILGGVMQNSAAAGSVQNQMNFQQDMSGTSYQRAVADMKKAGLNPALAYSQGGASTPMGSSYHPVNVASNVPSAVNTAASFQNVQANTELQHAQAASVIANTAKTKADTLATLATIPRKQASGTVWSVVNRFIKGGLSLIPSPTQYQAQFRKAWPTLTFAHQRPY